MCNYRSSQQTWSQLCTTYPYAYQYAHRYAYPCTYRYAVVPVCALKAYPSRYVRSRTPTGAVGLGYSIAIVVHSYVRTYDQVCTVASQELLAVTVKLATRTYVRTMPRRLSLYARQRARELMAQGASVKETTECLHKEGIFLKYGVLWRVARSKKLPHAIELHT